MTKTVSEDGETAKALEELVSRLGLEPKALAGKA